MKSLPAGIIGEAYAVSSNNPWLLFVEVDFTDGSKIFLVRNTENLTFGEQLYTAFPLEFDVQKETSKGEQPTRSVKISNVMRLLEGELEALGGAVASKVIVTVVSYKNLSSAIPADYADLTVTYEILAVSADTQWVVFTLGAPFMNRQRFPLDIYTASFCAHLRVYSYAGQPAPNYIGHECNYQGALTSCDGTLDGPNGCNAHGNWENFGGYPGLTSAALIVTQ